MKTDSDAHYHIMSRTNDRRFLFEKGSVKSELAATLVRTAAFCGVTLRAYAVMDNHFHAVVKVTKPDAPVPAEELLRRVGVLKGEKARERLAGHWDDLAAAGFVAALASEQERLRARMNDVSEFAKLFKEEFDRAYKRERKYCGSLWSGRFCSTLVEDGAYLARCIRYVVYNPVRAGIVTQASDYRWSWCENGEKEAGFAGPVPAGSEGREGPVPAGWWMRRVVQIGAGKVFGSAAFVSEEARRLGQCFNAAHVVAHAAGSVGFSTHGWRLAVTAA